MVRDLRRDAYSPVPIMNRVDCQQSAHRRSGIRVRTSGTVSSFTGSLRFLRLFYDLQATASIRGSYWTRVRRSNVESGN